MKVVLELLAVEFRQADGFDGNESTVFLWAEHSLVYVHNVR